MISYHRRLAEFDPTKYLLPALFFVLPFHRTFSLVIIYALALVVIVRAFQVKTSLSIPVHWFLPALYFYFVISGLVFEGKLSLMDTQLNLLVIPIVVGLQSKLYSNDKSAKERAFLAYIIGIAAAEFICFMRALVRSIDLEGFKIVFNPKVFPDADYDFLTSSVRDGNFFFGEEFSFIHHPIYFSWYVVVAQLIAFQQFTWNTTKGRKGSWLIIFYLLQFPVLFLLSSKTSILTSVILSSWLVLWKLKGMGWSSQILLIFCVISIGYLFVSLNPRMRIFKDTFLERLKVNPNARFGHDLRVLSWDASWEVIKKNWWKGVGETNKDQALIDVYAEKGYIIPERYKYNSHNQFLDFLISGGIWAFALFMAGLWSLFRIAAKGNNFTLIIFLLLFVINAVFENVLDRYAGVILFSLFTAYLLKDGRPQQQYLAS